MKTDVLVIGGGPGGYSAAFRAADLGKHVTIVDQTGLLGGTCLHVGCIPSKALLHITRLLLESQEAQHWGIGFTPPTIDLAKINAWKNNVVGQLSSGLINLQKRRKIELIQGNAIFKTPQQVCIQGDDETLIEFEHAIIATGSSSRTIPGIDLKSSRLMNSTEALKLSDIPEKLLIVGGSFISLELGMVYAALGSQVTLIEITEGLLPGVDRDLVRPIENRMNSLFEAMHFETKVVNVKEEDDGLNVSFDGKGLTDEKFDNVFYAVGRNPRTDNLGLENMNLSVDEQGFIPVDSQMRTKIKNIFAIGDITSGPMLAHKASHQGKIASEVIAGQASHYENLIPSVMYTDPEVAWCGLTETEAKEQNIPVKVGRFPWSASGRNLAMGRKDGTTKILFDPETQKVLGVGIVGAHAGDLLAEGVLAIKMGATATDLAETIHAHPSLSETIGGAAEVFLGTATDLYVPSRK